VKKWYKRKQERESEAILDGVVETRGEAGNGKM